MDSMSSGHSSGSGSGSGNTDMGVGRRRVTVKPLDEPDDDEIPTYMMRSVIHSCVSFQRIVYCVVEPSCVERSAEIPQVAFFIFVDRRCINTVELRLSRLTRGIPVARIINLDNWV
jgi:hypothetical protein